jgi:hypothetical protein
MLREREPEAGCRTSEWAGTDLLLMLGAQLTAKARQVTAKHAFVFACFRLPRRPERKTRYFFGSMAF